MPDAPHLWVPGAAGPLDQFVERVHRIVGQFASKLGREHVGATKAEEALF